MNRKLYAVVDLRTALGAKIWVEVHICREGDGGAVKGLLVQDDETFYVVDHIRHRYQQLLVFGEGAEIVVEGPHPLHLNEVENPINYLCMAHAETMANM